MGTLSNTSPFACRTGVGFDWRVIDTVLWMNTRDSLQRWYWKPTRTAGQNCDNTEQGIWTICFDIKMYQAGKRREGHELLIYNHNQHRINLHGLCNKEGFLCKQDDTVWIQCFMHEHILFLTSPPYYMRTFMYSVIRRCKLAWSVLIMDTPLSGFGFSPVS